MRSKTTEYPRPVLNEYLKDFPNSKFELCDPTFEETPEFIILKLSYSLECPGIEKLICDGFAKAIVRITCDRTSYRDAFDLKHMEDTTVSILKNLVVGNIEVQCIIVSTMPYDSYQLEEFNMNYFGDFTFTLRKGDIIANEPGIHIKLHSILEKSAAGVVQIAMDPNIDTMKVRYAKVDEENPIYSNYITILLPKREHEAYTKLRAKRHLKFGIERFLQSSLVLPVIVEAIVLIRDGELYETEDDNPYLGTIWADSIIQALKNKGVDVNDTPANIVELANMILSDVTSDAINNLMKKMTDWSNIRHEEDLL